MPLRPIFLVGAPDDGTSRLLASLSRGTAVWAAREDLLERAYDEAEAETEAQAIRDRFATSLRDREGKPANSESDGVAIAVTEGSAPFLAAVFPGARFIGVIGESQPEGLDGFGPARVYGITNKALLSDPREALRELCDWAGIAYDMALLGPLEHAVRLQGAGTSEPLSSQSTNSFPAKIAELGGSLLISTYQTGKLVLARATPEGALNTHFRGHDKPMGLAFGKDRRLALGTRTEVWDFRDVPEAAAKIEPEGSHDGCFIPRNRHVTGDIAIHEMEFAGDELWVVNTSWSCLATLDADHSFVPRWRPPFISSLGPGDRCHLNGMEVVDGEVKYATALGTTDTPGGWHEDKATGGVLFDVPSSEIVLSGLSMPHSPRWHGDELWLLQSGKGELCRADLATGAVETVAELPGFTRGLALVGRTAFVGLSQIRESSTFGDLPITQRLKERWCGVCMVDLDSGEITGFLRFEDLVQEIFAVLWLPDLRFPEIAEMTGAEVATTFALP